MEVRLIKEAGALQPYDTESEEWLNSEPPGQYFNASITTPRNYKFHKKFFALLNLAFNHWNPEPVMTRHGQAQKCRDQFREDLIILSGHYVITRRLDGTERIRAKSIKFSNMDEEEFTVLYDSIVTVIIQKILIGWTVEEIQESVGNFL